MYTQSYDQKTDNQCTNNESELCSWWYIIKIDETKPEYQYDELELYERMFAL